MDIHGFRQTIIKGDMWVMSCCPFHDDSNPSFGINAMTLEGHCFSCGWFQWPEILNQMGIPADADLDQIDSMTGMAWRAVKEKLDFGKFGTKEKIHRYYIPTKSLPIYGSPDHCSFLIARGIYQETMSKFDIRVCHDEKSKYYNRIIMPVNDPNGYPMFFDARTIDSSKSRKYIRPPKCPMRYCLGGIDKFKALRSKVGAVCEGYMDMLRLWQNGLPSVCCFGSKLYITQAKLLISLHLDYIVLAFDNDKAGNEAVTEAKKVLEGCGSRILRLHLPPGKDPGEVDQSTLWSSNAEILRIIH